MSNNNISYPDTNDKKVMKVGSAILIIVFGIFGGWASLAPLATSSIATGEISLGYQKKHIQHLYGGEIREFLVENGDFVSKGSPLIKLDKSKYINEANALQLNIFELLGEKSRLIAELQNEQNLTFEKDLLLNSRIKDVNTTINYQRKVFLSNKKILEDEEEIVKKNITYIEDKILALNSLLENNQNIIETSDLKIKISSLQIQISNIQSNQLIEKKKLSNKLLEKLVKVKRLLKDRKEKISLLSDKIKRSVIKSPIDGVVMGLKVATIGRVIPALKSIVTIVPQDALFFIIAKVAITDIDKVQKGLIADVRFSAFNTREINVLDAKVLYVSADKLIDRYTGMPYYEARLLLTDKGRKELKNYGFTLVAGMPAEVTIKTGSRTLLSYFLKPFSDMIYRSFNEE